MTTVGWAPLRRPTATSDSDAAACQAPPWNRKDREPETWAQVRKACVAGESAPPVARRFDFGPANLRRRALFLDGEGERPDPLIRLADEKQPPLIRIRAGALPGVGL